MIETAASTILLSALSRSAIETVGSWLTRRGDRSVKLELDGDHIDLTVASEKEKQELIRRWLEKQESSGTGGIDKQEVEVDKNQAPGLRSPGVGKAFEPVTSEVGGAALTWSAEFFDKARSRIALVFRLNIILSVTLAAILLAAIAAAVVTGLQGKNTWALIFGGVSVVDIAGVFVLRPLSAITGAVIASQRLEVIHMRLLHQLQSCAAHSDLDKRLKCQTNVWNTIQRELTAMVPS
jgi:hypothetical protein